MQRLRRRRDLQRVFREGRRVQAGALLLHACRRQPDEPVPVGPRLTVVAGKRFPSAVARNRARRVTREACRVLLRDAQEPWDLVLVVRAEAVEQPYQQRLGGLAGLFRRAGVLSDKIVAVP